MIDSGVRWIACLVATTAAVVSAGARGADWPMYQHDTARSAVTSEQLPLPLALQWVFESPHPPARGWDEPEHDEVWSYGVRRVGRVRYDDSFHVAAVGDNVYFASSAENRTRSTRSRRRGRRSAGFSIPTPHPDWPRPLP